MTNSPATISPDAGSPGPAPEAEAEPTRARSALALVLGALPWLVAAGLVGAAGYLGGYLATIVAFALIYAVFVTGLNIFMGFTAQVSFGHNAFAAIGGYTSAVLTTTYEWPPLAAFAAGLAGSLALAGLIGWPTLRLKGHYLSMGTLAIGLIVYEIAVQWESVTQGYLGISGIPSLGIGRFEATGDRQILAVLTATVLLGAFVVARMRRSRFGRALAAVAGSEEAARALGIDVARYKLASFLLSAGFASLAGSLFVHVVGYVSPEVFGLHMVILAFTMLYVGGLGTVVGPIIGALVISLLPETFRGFRDYQDLGYGAALILLLIYAPRGMAGLIDLAAGRKAS
ncbi:branched-chain amino acid ABC transporter permease [Prosthecodimorpha staleyi]|uniref:Branched-chain amino acid ABC transporter permease n=1 Tax=Prosthecodimorpha staleyi TaxID=2840188 RepID=A0A947DBP7_9HYPH|nr:branched-chain amino acid ABC transporter permease [Prosthecodimorpha staleyi]MBT9292842.1 branched-chain amino acid ABC transporter permease [Prosthecodimorpha staleyi]